jgi:hypothetical protein
MSEDQPRCGGSGREQRQIRSYVRQHENGRIGTVCIYQATDPEALREQARSVGMPAETIAGVASSVRQIRFQALQERKFGDVCPRDDAWEPQALVDQFERKKFADRSY